MTGLLRVNVSPDRQRPGADRARPPRRPGNVTLAAAAALVVVLTVTGLVLQVTHPFIRHDDWAFAVSPDEPGAINMWGRNLYEGRWLSRLWWRVLGQHLSVSVASAIFVLAYSAWVVGVVRLLPLFRWWHQMLATTALAVSVVWIRLVYWPSSLSPSMVVAAVAVWLIPWARRREVTWWSWLVGSVVLAVLSYPPVALMLLFVVAVTERDSDRRRLLRAALGFVLAYGLGVLVVSSLNWMAFGAFGVRLSQWRHPNPLRGFDDLVTNLEQYRRQLWSLVAALGAAAVLGLVAAGWALRNRSSRRGARAVLGAGLLALGLEAGLTVVTGTTTGVRASLWSWPLLALPAVFLLGARQSVARRVGVVTLVGLTIVGGLQWRHDLDLHQQTRDQYASLVGQVAAEKQRFPGLPVVIWMEPDLRATPGGNMTAVTVRMMSQDLDGIYPRWCSPTECARLAATFPPPPRGGVVVRDGLIVLRLPSPPAWL